MGGKPNGRGRLIGWYRRVAQRLGHTRALVWIGIHILTPVDKWLYPRAKGRVLSFGPPILPTLMLTTIGRKSGRPRTSPLVYISAGEDLVVVGSNFGQQHHPAWSANLLANPSAEVQIAEQRRRVVARLATPEEKARFWPEFLEVWPAYQRYAERSGRDLRMFLLSPR